MQTHAHRQEAVVRLPRRKLGQIARRPHLTFVRWRERETAIEDEFRQLRLRSNIAAAHYSSLLLTWERAQRLTRTPGGDEPRWLVASFPVTTRF